jgi:hypothetical protein
MVLAAISSARQVSDAHIIATAETFAVRFSVTSSKIRVTVLLTVVDIGSAMIADVFARAFNSIAESLALDIIPLLRGRLPVVVILRAIVLRSALACYACQVRDSNFIAPPESFAVCLPVTSSKIRVTILLTVVDIWGAMIADVLARPFNAIAESLALKIIPLLRGRLPVAISFTAAIHLQAICSPHKWSH